MSFAHGCLFVVLGILEGEADAAPLIESMTGEAGAGVGCGHAAALVGLAG